MKGKIVLGKNYEYEFYDYKILFDSGEIDYVIYINSDLGIDFQTLITFPTDFGQSIDTDIYFFNTNEYEDSEEMIKLLKIIKQNQLKYLQNAEYVQFDFENKEVLEYLKQNPILKTKKIILKQNLDLNDQPVAEIKELFGEYINNLYFKLPGNTNYISFNEYEDTITALDILAEEINKFNFSPLEKIMYVYDMIRERIYQKEDINEDCTTSRDLSSSLLGKKIVCLGYTRIFNALLEKIGIYSNEVFLDGPTKGHARSEIHIQDEKYGINGVYYFDPTWDSKRNKEDNNYILSYYFFAKTRREIDQIDLEQKKEYINRFFPYYSENMDIEFDELYGQENIKNIPDELIRSINHMSRTINHESLLRPIELDPASPLYRKINKEEVVNKISELIEYYEQPLNAEIFLSALYNVRKQQYYQNPTKYPFSIGNFHKTFLISKWHFEPSPEERLFASIFGEEQQTNPTNRIIGYVKRTNLHRKVEEIKLTKTLQKVLEYKIKK